MYKIFIVEDDKGIADGITSCLGNWGMEGRTVSDFMKVLEEIEEYEPHLIIMDITLPYMGGYHWCQVILIFGFKILCFCTQVLAQFCGFESVCELVL